MADRAVNNRFFDCVKYELQFRFNSIFEDGITRQVEDLADIP